MASFFQFQLSPGTSTSQRSLSETKQSQRETNRKEQKRKEIQVHLTPAPASGESLAQRSILGWTSATRVSPRISQGPTQKRAVSWRVCPPVVWGKQFASRKGPSKGRAWESKASQEGQEGVVKGKYVWLQRRETTQSFWDRAGRPNKSAWAWPGCLDILQEPALVWAHCVRLGESKLERSIFVFQRWLCMHNVSVHCAWNGYGAFNIEL